MAALLTTITIIQPGKLSIEREIQTFLDVILCNAVGCIFVRFPFADLFSLGLFLRTLLSESLLV